MVGERGRGIDAVDSHRRESEEIDDGFGDRRVGVPFGIDVLGDFAAEHDQGDAGSADCGVSVGVQGVGSEPGGIY